MNIRLTTRYIGIALLFNAMFMFISLGVSALNDFDSSFTPLLLSALVTAMVGCFPLIFVRTQDEVNLREGFAITIFSWLLSCIFGMLPYVMWGGEFTLSNAWYESVSGYTTTGGTILQNVEALPKGLLFWRSSTHFIGGMGVMVFMLLVLPSVSSFRMRISRIEISSISKDNYRYRSKETVHDLEKLIAGDVVFRDGLVACRIPAVVVWARWNALDEGAEPRKEGVKVKLLSSKRLELFGPARGPCVSCHQVVEELLRVPLRPLRSAGEVVVCVSSNVIRRDVAGATKLIVAIERYSHGKTGLCRSPN